MLASERVDVVWRSCSDDLVGYAFSLCGDRSQALDVVQESFVRLISQLQRSPTLLNEDSARPWLFKVVRNLVVDNFRRKENVSTATTDTDPNHSRNGDNATELDGFYNLDTMVVDRIVINNALDALSSDHRIVIDLVVVEGLSLFDASEILKVPIGTVKSRIYYGLKKARENMGEEVR
ncbi:MULTISPECIES: sigma-70 family RNA polymerase sigma factor [Acidithrix]|uniref:ECF RNA polymerase sigma factor SigL n=1 Tax=Acidithrix ferrooxidans TaxID=1280514 RepID=A0A0D8HJT8_9ACTN|nr:MULTISPECIES: sigma-70 family RNA polymerase sigma factor [Acidithrix]KJF18002.1 ECF RNA polymerase sigma factor SigL [Acidithrix ferrooxidans]CAG4918228.1 unnamed protein product [Acidithrix sp. C25]